MPLGPCAKRTVLARLQTADGRSFVGLNLCRNPQPRCPRQQTRAERNDYRLCDTQCEITGHAEVNAVLAALRQGANLRGARMLVHHHRVCPNCQAFLRSLSIPWELVPATAALGDLDTQLRASLDQLTGRLTGLEARLDRLQAALGQLAPRTRWLRGLAQRLRRRFLE